MKPKTPGTPGPLRLFAVIAYDLMLLLSVLLIAGFVAVALNGGEAIGANNPVFVIYLLAVCIFFYGWFWTHGGQTLGMRAWRVYLMSHGQVGISWKQAFMRFSIAIISFLALGLGFIWLWLSKEKLSWHDLFSGSQLVYFPKEEIG
ncbi:hypothetical protein MPL1_08728 [Methylophaga lonarensis MPL]|uniref:RDD domain-containing protein n=1 Tax=Methylophaga lonarensis MPL TaxID=1286106 RepID=M7NZT8_9GAMM|nr:RDD family protein [Methylophaga lonarensis]EMR12736.1 hypothetical protein MPL1_08728 [Methylophaga lonarensis MPL]